MINVIILGSGNVATHLCHAFMQANSICLKQIYSRNTKNIEFTNVLKTNTINNLADADVYIIAITDDAIKALASKLEIEGKFVVHTSGNVSINTLGHKNRTGVFYPLQTFSKHTEIDFKNVPICAEAENKNDLLLLQKIAKSIGSPFYQINSQQRSKLHLAAVFANNFTNQMYHIANTITANNNIDFDILKPLIIETAKKTALTSPFEAQTGPAKRNDQQTINNHLTGLKNKTYKAIYELLTSSITQTHGKKL